MRCFLTRAVISAAAMLAICIGTAAVSAEEYPAKINETNFPDEVFRAYVSEKFDTDRDGFLSQSETDNVQVMYVMNKAISDLKGIEYFTELAELYCYGNRLTSLDVSKNVGLEMLCCYNNVLTSLDVSCNTALTELSCGENLLTSLDVSGCTGLDYLSCPNNRLTSLDVSNNSYLSELSCGGNSLSDLDIGKCYFLTFLSCPNNCLTSLDVSANTALLDLDCFGNLLASLDLSFNNSLEYLNCSCNRLTSLDVSANTALMELICSDNQLGGLDVRKNVRINNLDIGNNRIEQIDLSKNSALIILTCSNNCLTSLDLSNNTELAELYCENNIRSIGDVVKSYPVSKLSADFCPANVSDLQGAYFDHTNRFLQDFDDTTVTYVYDCGFGFTASFTLLADSYIAGIEPPYFSVKGVFGGRNVTFNCNTPDTVIYYTTENRSELRLTDPCVKPGETVLFKAYYGTIYARAYCNGKWSNSARLILRIPKVNTPSITKLANGKYKIKTTTPGTIVYYTIDGTTPSATNYKGKFWTSHDVYIPAGKTVKAIAVRNCFSDSEVAAAKT